MPITTTFSPTYASIDLNVLGHNLHQFRRHLSPGCDVLAVVKANAYGHGSGEITKALIRHGVSRVAVVSVEEGITLRQAGIDAPIVVLGLLYREQIADLLAHQLTPVVSDISVLQPLGHAAATLRTPYPVHIKVETGMGRLGLTQDELADVVAAGRFPKSLHLEGLMTHLADSDEPDAGRTEQQLTRFTSAIETVQAGGFRVPLIHAANSGSSIRFPHAQFSLVRPGIMLYGYHNLPSTVAAPSLKPVLSLQTCIAQLRTIQQGERVSYNGRFTATRRSRIAVLPVGYADGLSRHLSNRGQVLVRGHRVPIIGLVCMDMTMVDVTDVPGACTGDDVILIGRQGTEQITAEDIAEWTGTISYEVLCSIGPRIPRRYHSV